MVRVDDARNVIHAFDELYTRYIGYLGANTPAIIGIGKLGC